MTSTQLKEWRRTRSWDQEQLASKLNVSVHTVRAWEQGKNPVPHWVEKDILSEAELKVPLGLIGQINDVAASRKISFDDALSLLLKSGLITLDSLKQSPKRRPKGAGNK